ncbi:MAG: phosphoribosyltransferase [Gomphosphaeria aponina SAG 52.96 = DSM 107014]|uniref:Phosphoribosyltransferase n=1 Tax=Gomphosphaeria aponina SAG 52.96 = DSM 107014 TaxID=1521640 RepID=A0A941JTP1_9CHRO|nr:phosphoribosyltransferase [Gomphosphaeria aponina SAG 52.96 = DSM 107014]
MPELYISWSGYHRKIEALAAKIYQSNWEFNQIVCIAKGGLRLGDILSRIYEQPLAIMFTASYGGTGNRIRGEIKVSEHLAMINEKLGNKILLVDDLADSGISLQAAIGWLKERYATEIEEMRTAVIWYKGCSVIQPDFYVDYLPDNPWIHQPFEKYEQLRPEQLDESAF